MSVKTWKNRRAHKYQYSKTLYEKINIKNHNSMSVTKSKNDSILFKNYSLSSIIIAYRFINI